MLVFLVPLSELCSQVLHKLKQNLLHIGVGVFFAFCAASLGGSAWLANCSLRRVQNVTLQALLGLFLFLFLFLLSFEVLAFVVLLDRASLLLFRFLFLGVLLLLALVEQELRLVCLAVQLWLVRSRSLLLIFFLLPLCCFVVLNVVLKLIA